MPSSRFLLQVLLVLYTSYICNVQRISYLSRIYEVRIIHSYSYGVFFHVFTFISCFEVTCIIRFAFSVLCEFSVHFLDASVPLHCCNMSLLLIIACYHGLKQCGRPWLGVDMRTTTATRKGLFAHIILLYTTKDAASDGNG